MSSEVQPIGTCVIVKKGNTILLGKRKNAYKSGEYGMPGGKIEGNEEAQTAADRELAEETGLIAAQLSYLGVVKEWQETKNFIHFMFVCEDWKGEPQVLEPDKCEGWEWFPLDDLPANILAGHLAGIKLLHSANLNLVEI